MSALRIMHNSPCHKSAGCWIWRSGCTLCLLFDQIWFGRVSRVTESMRTITIFKTTLNLLSPSSSWHWVIILARVLKLRYFNTNKVWGFLVLRPCIPDFEHRRSVTYFLVVIVISITIFRVSGRLTPLAARRGSLFRHHRKKREGGGRVSRAWPMIAYVDNLSHVMGMVLNKKNQGFKAKYLRLLLNRLLLKLKGPQSIITGICTD